MEQHGKNSPKSITAIIPARLISTRLANKLLLDLNGKPLVLHTLEQAKKAKNISRVIVATDSPTILKIIEASGGEAIMTSENHQSGSDRIAEVAETLPENSIIVNVQGDEPLISPATIEKAVEAILENNKIQMTTTCEKISDAKDVLSPDVVKVVADENGFALYFSRAPIPFPRDAVKKYGGLENALLNEPDLIKLFRKHTGLYVYRREFLLKYTKLKQTHLEKTEMLEQLRALENGAKIKVVEVSESSIGIDTQADFERVEEIIKRRKKQSANFTYRKANIKDIPRIANVHVESWRKSFTGIVPQEFLNKMSDEKRAEAFRKGFAEDSYKMFVAEDSENGIIGFADFGKSRDEKFSGAAELYAIYFLPEFQRQGIGGKLFKLCLKEIAENNFNSMYLIALKVSPYKSFYEKMGGRVVGKGTHKLAEVEFETIFYGWKDLQNYTKK